MALWLLQTAAEIRCSGMACGDACHCEAIEDGRGNLKLTHCLTLPNLTLPNLAQLPRLCHNPHMAVDTLRLYERFSKAGMTDAAAKEVAEAIKESNDDLLERIATKEDLKITELALRQDLKTEVARLEVHLIKWMIGVGVGGFTALLGLLKLLAVI